VTQVGLIHEKTEGQKSLETVPLSKIKSLCSENFKHIFKFKFVPVLPKKNTFKQARDL
jgi:hypothetical protein